MTNNYDKPKRKIYPPKRYIMEEENKNNKYCEICKVLINNIYMYSFEFEHKLYFLGNLSKKVSF